ncbi:ROK family protein [Enterococcus alcedinis]|uniref:ROK family protein n=1 Tax=Enterococcus alcedinis TaxID=1274384 RepID=UPI003620B361
MKKVGLAEEEIALGVGVPGIVDSKNGIAIFQNNLDWENFPIRDRLQAAFPKVDMIKIDNDVVHAGFAEWRASGLTKEDSLVFLTISTGIASPIFEGGVPIRGRGLAGEVGLVPVRTANGTKTERLEFVASGSALEAKAQARYVDATMTSARLFEQYLQNEARAVELIDDFLDSLTHGVYIITSLINPTQIVLGGSVLMRNPYLLPLLKERLLNEMLPVQQESVAALVLSQYENNASLVGAGLSVV